MGTVSKEQLKKLFAAVDRRLKANLDIYIIGGASVILGYNVVKETNDVDIDGAMAQQRAGFLCGLFKLAKPVCSENTR